MVRQRGRGGIGRRGGGRGGASSSSNESSMSPAFGRALQFITTIKLQELEKQRLSYMDHSVVLDEADKAASPIEKVEILLRGVRGWAGSGGLSDDTVGGKLDLTNLDIWLQQSKKDPSFSMDILHGWAETLEAHLRHNQTRFDFARLFGNLFNEWLSSGDSVTAAPGSEGQSSATPSTPSETFVEVGRTEMLEQKERLQSIIFNAPAIHTDAVRAYLEGLFSSDDAVQVLSTVRTQLEAFSVSLLSRTFHAPDVRWGINSLLNSDLMNEEKRATLKEFLNNDLILNELASVLNMRLAGLSSWSWPADGVTVEMRRHLNGKYRAFTDPDIVDGLLLQMLGVLWQIQLKQAFQTIFASSAWAPSITPPSKNLRDRQTYYLGGATYNNVEAYRCNVRRGNFIAGQLANSVTSRSSYDDDDNASGTDTLPAIQVKQQLIHMMSTDCHLNTALHGAHTVVRSDLEWFGPSLPHESILEVLSFFGISEDWLTFFKTFLRAPTRFKEEPGAGTRIRERGTPISYAFSAFFGEAILFVMDFAVNQKADGLFLYRIHDDLWFWDPNQSRCEAAWEAMGEYASVMGLKFNQEKTGSACVGGELRPKLPSGDVRWGFLRFDSKEARFVIDQAEVDSHIAELRRQLGSTKSIFGWVNAYNKYMAFFRRNFGGRPPACFGRVHVDDMVDTFARIQRELFPGAASTGGAVGYLRQVIQERFEMEAIPEGYFYFPIAHGGLELRNPMIEVFALWTHDKEDDPRRAFIKEMAEDQRNYKQLKSGWENNRSTTIPWNDTAQPIEFMSYDEYTSQRELTLPSWSARYSKLMSVPPPMDVKMTPALEAVEGSLDFDSLDYYGAWVVALYGEELLKKFGTLDVVDPNLIPVGMVQLFKTSRMKWEQ